MITLLRVWPVPCGSDGKFSDETIYSPGADRTARQLRAKYLIEHPGPVTTVHNEMTIDVTMPGYCAPESVARIVVETPPMPTTQEAVDKLADWLDRLAKGMRQGSVDAGFPLRMVATERAIPVKPSTPEDLTP